MLSKMFTCTRARNKKEEEVSMPTTYEDTIKSEFIEMAHKFSFDRVHFHVYAIDRFATTATLVGFSYKYTTKVEKEGQTHLVKVIDLGDYGTLEFKLDNDNEYGTLYNSDRKEVVRNLIKGFPTTTNI